MGGAAGHMNHPFDLGWVKTGSNLIEFFDRAKTYLEEKNASSVKIDGVNVSFKVVDVDGKKQFAVDRGSSAEVDISGITMDRISEKFPEGHGMRIYIAEMLAFLNDAINDAKPALEKLGMWDDPTKFLNAEYAKEGVTNIITYDRKLLALHGVNQFYEKIAKSGKNKGNMRPGLDRPTYVDPKSGKVKKIKDASSEIPYDTEALKELVEILKPFGEEYGFFVFGDIPSENTIEIDFAQALSEPFSIKISDDKTITKSLSDWLKTAENPGYFPLKRTDGKPSHPFHKELYKTILGQEIALMDYIQERNPENSVDWSKAVDGAVMLHATRMLGNEVLKTLESELGNLENHEGVIFRDSEVFGTQKPVKITGDFIIGGTESAFQKGASITEEDEEIEIDLQPEEKTLAIVPGAFKPPHMGHAAMVKAYAQVADEVLVLISKPTKSGRKLPNGREITARDSLKIWNLLVGDLPNVDVEISSHASPINAAYEYVGKDGPVEPGTKVILGASSKGNDATRWIGAEKYIKDGVILLDPMRTVVDPITRENGEPFSATDMRELLGDSDVDVDALSEFIGRENVYDLLSILGLDTALSELSSVSNGAVEGDAVGAHGGPWGRSFAAQNADEKQRSMLRKENNITVDEVMRLIMEKGILL